MGKTYVDIRLELYPEKSHVCETDLEFTLAFGEVVCDEIKENYDEFPVANVEVVNIGKINPMVLDMDENLLIDE